MFINIKLIRKTTNFLIDLIYKTPFKKTFLWIISRIPIGLFSNYVWINSPQYYLNSFEKDFLVKLKQAGINFKGKHILEIGSGSSFGWGYFFIIGGAKSYTSTDLARSVNMSTRAIKTELSLIKLVEQKYKKKILGKYIAFKDKQLISLTNKLQFKIMDITTKNLKVRRQYDIIISNAVLEHLPKKSMPRAIKNMYQLLKNDGYMLHQIDLRDHYNFHQQFNFYGYSEFQWERLTNLGYFYTNRLRTSNYLALFKQRHFKVIYKKVTMCQTDQKPIKARLSHYFKTYPLKELGVINLIIALKKL